MNLTYPYLEFAVLLFYKCLESMSILHMPQSKQFYKKKTCMHKFINMNVNIIIKVIIIIVKAIYFNVIIIIVKVMYYIRSIRYNFLIN